MRFLNPTAKPTPRRTSTGVGGAPGTAGTRRAASSAAGPAGSGSAGARRGSPRRPAAVPVMRWPVSSSSPGASALRSRSSTGSTPQRGGELVHLRLVARSRSAPRRSRASRRTAGCWCARRRRRSSAFGTRYGPAAKQTALAMTRHDDDAYAPPSSTMRASTLHERAVGLGAVAHPHARRMTVHVAEERLLAVVHHLHRPAGAQGEQARGGCAG